MERNETTKQVFIEILQWGTASPIFENEKAVREVFTKKLDLPDQYDMVELESLFNEYQRYGEKISIIKNKLEEKVGEAKFAKDVSKTRYDIIKKQAMSGHATDVNIKQLEEKADDLEKFDEIYRAWKYFYGVSKDKWDLLNKTFNHIRGCITTLRAELAKGV